MLSAQVILLPRENYYAWVGAAQAYGLKFGVSITASAETAGKIGQVVTIAGAPDAYPEQGDIRAWFAAHFPDVRLDYLPVDSPEALRQLLDQRLAANERYPA